MGAVMLRVVALGDGIQSRYIHAWAVNRDWRHGKYNKGCLTLPYVAKVILDSKNDNLGVSGIFRHSNCCRAQWTNLPPPVAPGILQLQ